MSADGRQNNNIRGTREWAVAEINCCLGCPHDCLYCYARYDQVQIKAKLPAGQWPNCRVLSDEVSKVRPLFPGRVMFPTAHDIVPDNLEACLTVLKNLLAAGNRVLVVSKPHLACVRRLCTELSGSRRQLLFRFTITARNDTLLALWEPHAPSYKERKDCLRYAFDRGFATSVSVEPMLDTADVVAMVHDLLPFVSDTIWLGKMNRIEQRVHCRSEEMGREIERLKEGQSDDNLRLIYRRLQHIPELRWKESIKEVLGLPLPQQPGLDL